MSLLETINGHDVLANRPTATAANEGYNFHASDTGITYRSNGASWDELAIDTGAHAAIDHTGIPGVGGGSGTVPWSIVPEGGAAVVQFRTSGAANRGLYAPATVPAACTITGIRVSIGTQSGDIDVGLYDSAGNRVASSGSTACPAAGLATIAFAASYAAAAGRYYLAIAFNNNTATFGANQNVANGVSGPATARFQATAFPLPATASFSEPITSPAIIGIISGGHP